MIENSINLTLLIFHFVLIKSLLQKMGIKNMIKGLGIDIVEVKRIKKMKRRWQERFLTKIFTEQEIDYCQSKKNSAQHLAARFAAKEALVKCLGTGFRNISLIDIEVIKDNQGKPVLKVYGRARELVEKKGIEKLHISLSHEKKYAVAEVIGEGGFK